MTGKKTKFKNKNFSLTEKSFKLAYAYTVPKITVISLSKIFHLGKKSTFHGVGNFMQQHKNHSAE